MAATSPVLNNKQSESAWILLSRTPHSSFNFGRLATKQVLGFLHNLHERIKTMVARQTLVGDGILIWDMKSMLAFLGHHAPTRLTQNPKSPEISSLTGKSDPGES